MIDAYEYFEQVCIHPNHSAVSDRVFIALELKEPKKPVVGL
jgi:hypothetical protein